MKILLFLLKILVLKTTLSKKILRNLSETFRTSTESPKSLTTCNKKMLNSYGLTGYQSATETTHKYCPMVNKNCCNPKDETLSMHTWNANAKYQIETYYEMYLFSLKYLLGFSNEALNLARDYKDSKNGVCGQAAQKLVNLKMDENVSGEIFRNLEFSLEKMGDLRRGFYCVLCDAKTHADLREFWNTPNERYKNRLYFSQDFCKRLVSDTIKSSYYTVNYLKKFLESFATLVSCKAGNSTQIEYPVPHEELLKIRNCFFFKEKYFFFFCEKYCESLDLTKPSPIFDGNVKVLRNFFNHISLYRKEVFYYPAKNFLVKDVSHIESFLRRDFEKAVQTDVFLKSTNNNLTFDSMKSDVVFHGGIEPFGSVENNLYQLLLESLDCLKVGVVFVLLWV